MRLIVRCIVFDGRHNATMYVHKLDMTRDNTTRITHTYRTVVSILDDVFGCSYVL